MIFGDVSPYVKNMCTFSHLGIAQFPRDARAVSARPARAQQRAARRRAMALLAKELWRCSPKSLYDFLILYGVCSKLAPRCSRWRGTCSRFALGSSSLDTHTGNTTVARSMTKMRSRDSTLITRSSSEVAARGTATTSTVPCG